MDLESDPNADLARLVADTRQLDASRARTRERLLRQQAAEETTLQAVLFDLAEAHHDVTMAIGCGRTLHGHLRAVGSDFVIVRAGGADALVPIPEIMSVRRSSDLRHADPSERARASGPSLAAYLGGLAPEHPKVTIVPRGGSVVQGELRACGADVLVIHADGVPPVQTYVPLPSVSMLTVWAG